VTCFAKVKDVDPEGDVDSDGVLNKLDQCNRIPTNLTSAVDTDGERLGCAKDQPNDTEYFEGLDSSNEIPDTDPPEVELPDVDLPDVKPIKVPKYWGDDRTGLAWVDLGKMCWYDAMDLRSSERCIVSSLFDLRSADFISVLSPWKKTSDTKKGCKRDLGDSWSLPSYSQLSAIVSFRQESAASWSKTGTYVSSVFGRQDSSWELVTKPFRNVSDPKLVYMPVKCVAKVKDIDPTEDIDDDGIPNGVDQCNRLPDDSKAELNTEGEWIGCVEGQVKDSDL